MIKGLAGADVISAGNGNDTVIGGIGADRLTGGSGADKFVFESLDDAGDVIVDFARGSDKLDLTAIADASSLGDASLSTLIANGNIVIETGKFSTGTTTNSTFSNDTRVYFDADGGGPGTRVLIATVEDVQLTSTDFLV